MICPGCGSCFACRLRAKNFALGPAIQANRISNNSRRKGPRTADPAWERGIKGERRPDGSFMPLLTAKGAPLRVKEYGENRRQIEDRVKRLKTDPHVFAKP